MKLLRYSDGKLVKPGILDDAGKIRDVSLAVKDWTGKTINDEIINRIKNCSCFLFRIYFNFSIKA